MIIGTLKDFFKDMPVNEIRPALIESFILFRRQGDSRYKRLIMAITGHKTFCVFTRYDTVSEDDLKTAVLPSVLEKSGTFLEHLGESENGSVVQVLE